MISSLKTTSFLVHFLPHQECSAEMFDKRFTRQRARIRSVIAKKKVAYIFLYYGLLYYLKWKDRVRISKIAKLEVSDDSEIL